MTDSSTQNRAPRPGQNEWSPHAHALGFEVVDVAKDTATLKVPFRDDLIGDPETGVIAGGVVMALLDHVCGHAVMMALDTLTNIATLDLRIDYMRAAKPGQSVTARADCYKKTRSIAFVRASAWDLESGDPVATAQAAFMINSSPEPKAAKS